MLINEVLSLLLEKKIHFSSDDFVRGFRTRDFSLFDLKLGGLWLLLYADVYSATSRELSLLSPRITQLSKTGLVMLFAWPVDDDCMVIDYTNSI